MFAKLKRFAGQSFIYTLGETLRSSLSLLLLPVYTRVLTVDEYGILGVVVPIYSFLSLLLGLGLPGALMRYYFDYDRDPEAQRAYIGTVSTFLLAGSVSIALLLTLSGPRLFGLFLAQTPFNPYILLTVWNACISISQVIPLTLFRARQQPLRFVLFTLGDFLLTTGLIIFFVVGMRQGVLGNLRAQVLAALLMAVPALWIVTRSGRLCLSRSYLSQSLAFGLPLLPHALGNWVLNLSDRIVLENLVSQGELGLYTLGYQFGTFLNLVTIALNNAWTPFFYRQAGDQNNEETISLFVTYQVLAVAGLGLALALLSREAMEIMAAPAYWTAYQVVPWVVLGYFARFLYFFPVNGLFYSKRTYWVPVATVTAGILNVGLNFWLVPRFGIVAAAFNTFLGFLALLFVTFVVGQRVFPIRYQYRRLAQIILVAVGVYAAGWLVAPAGLWIRIVFKSGLLAAFVGILGLIGFFSPAERRKLAQLWHTARGRLA